MMKRMIASTIVLLIIACILFACNDNAPPDFEETIQENISITTEPRTINWTTYAPGDIELFPDEHFYDQDIYELGIGLRKYRMVYYGIDDWFLGLIRDIEDIPPIGSVIDIDRIHRGPNGEWIESDVMDLVVYIKHYKIAKEDFIKAMKEGIEGRLTRSDEWDEVRFDHEDSELPNADIIYTFDNEIINAYYRRENPVVPDWLKE